MRTLSVLPIALAALLAVATPAAAVPISLQVDPLLTNLVIEMTALSVGEQTPLAVSGDVGAEINLQTHPVFGLVATSLQLQGGSLAASHEPLSPPIAPGISLTFSSAGLGGVLGGPIAAAIPVAPGLSVADFRDTSAIFDSGALSIFGDLFSDPVDEVLDLSELPISLLLHVNSLGQIAVGEPQPGMTGAAVSIPIDAATSLMLSDLAVDIRVSGTLALKGTIVPEPATAVLLGGALLLGCLAGRARCAMGHPS